MQIIRANAKINLNLKVYKKRFYEKKHRILSKMVIVNDLYDEIKIEDNNKNFDNINSDIILFKNNVVTYVMKILRQNKIIKKHYNISIKKNIPLYSGLGGFSSIAVSIANYFIKNINKKDRNKIIKKVCDKVGTDCWFFFSGFKAATVSGYGNIVKELFFEKNIYKKDLIFLPVKCDTKFVYQTFDKHKLWKFSSNENMLTTAIEISYPEIKNMYDYHDYFFSGSGSTVVKKLVRTY